MKKAMAILCAVLFSACTQAAQTAPQTSETSAESVTEITTEAAATTASQTAAVTTTAVVSSASTTSETSETTDITAEDATETTETASETSTEATTAETSGSAAETSPAVMVDEEKQKILDEMPDIVFVMSEHVENTNICGLYVTKTGEIKMFDFRNIAPKEIYEIPDVYDRLEEATCDRLDPPEYNEVYGDWYKDNDSLTSDELGKVDINDLVMAYNVLCRLSNNAEKFFTYFSYPEPMPYYEYYGIRKNGDYAEIVLFGGGENDYDYGFPDEEMNESAYLLLCEVSGWFPMMPIYE